MKLWEKISEKIFASNDYWSYKIDEFRIEGGVTGTYHYVHTPGSTMVIPVTDDNRLVLIKQYRYLNTRFGIEFPCGGVKPGLSCEENALKELREETGFTAASLIRIGEFSPFTGAADEICTVFLGQSLLHSPLEPDATEEFEILRLTPDEVQDKINTNEIWDGLTLSAWALAQTRLREII